MADDIVYFEDIAVGDRFDFGPLTVSREEVIRFAAAEEEAAAADADEV